MSVLEPRLARLNFAPLSVLPLLNAVIDMIIGALTASVLHNRVPAPEAVNRSRTGVAE